jgi:hypothetical protein
MYVLSMPIAFCLFIRSRRQFIEISLRARSAPKWRFCHRAYHVFSAGAAPKIQN